MIGASVIVVAGLGLLMGLGLLLADRFLAVEKDPRIERVAEALPNANCGGCGFAGCADFAKALVEGRAKASACAPLSAESAAVVAGILGVAAEARERVVALVRCAGGDDRAARRSRYVGVADCRAAELVGGDKACPFGCLGLGTCEAVCAFGAVVVTGDRLAYVDAERCTGCGACVGACPRGIIRLVPKAAQVHVLCSSRDKAKVVKRYCEVGCIACRLCSRECDAFDTSTGLSVLDYTFSGEIPPSAALVCAPGSIHDGRAGPGLAELLVGDAAREALRQRQEAYREERKQARAAARARRDGAGEER
jgi:electron transport complex protein RnfB